jgi:hypothetical protein
LEISISVLVSFSVAASTSVDGSSTREVMVYSTAVTP